MPRHSDPAVEGRILEAARKLWRKGGEKSLNMRAVAKLAGTNTPAVYRRYRNREEILRALVESYQQEVARQLQPCSSIQEMAQKYANYALKYPQEHHLMMSGLLARMTKLRPNFEFALSRTSEWLGGDAKDHRKLMLAIVALIDGVVLLRSTGWVREEDVPALRAGFTKALDVLVENESQFRNTAESAQSCVIGP
jgi:AcrR family transcriptional regulator